MMYKHIDAFLYLGAHEFRNSGRGTFCWEVDPVWVASAHGDKFGYCRVENVCRAGVCPRWQPFE